MSDRIHLIELIRTEARDYTSRAKKTGQFGQVPEGGKNLFTIHTANQWMELEKNTPPARMLFGELWQQGELCILFADTNAGKSILAVQIGNALAAREQMPPFGCEANKCDVVYIDFELSAAQFHARYTHNDVTYTFAKSFYRAEFNPAATLPPDYKTFNEYMKAAIEYAVVKTGASVLIVDNITCLRGDTGHAGQALPLMQHLKALKTKYGLSVLVLAHTPKRNPALPVTRNDLEGSKMLMNFADSAFAIGESHIEKGLRYLKQVKQRSGQCLYGADNVCLFRIAKRLNFLKFEFSGFGAERDHLYCPKPPEGTKTEACVLELSQTGLSQRQIAYKLGIALGRVNRILKEKRE
jgi:predicted ATP-dependent serine protease